MTLHPFHSFLGKTLTMPFLPVKWSGRREGRKERKKKEEISSSSMARKCMLHLKRTSAIIMFVQYLEKRSFSL